MRYPSPDVWKGSSNLIPNTDLLANLAQEQVFLALKEKRWNDAYVMAFSALREFPEDHSHDALRINLWMARRELGEDGDQLRREVEAWIPGDHDLTSEIGKAAILRNEERTLLLLSELANDHEDSPASVATWPLIVDMAARSKPIAAWVQAQRPGKRLRQREPQIQQRRKHR